MVYILSLILKCNVKIYIFLRKYLLLAHIFLVSTLASRKIISFSSNLFLRTSCSRPSLSLILSARFRFRIFNSSQRIHFSIFNLICSRRKSLRIHFSTFILICYKSKSLRIHFSIFILICFRRKSLRIHFSIFILICSRRKSLRIHFSIFILICSRRKSLIFVGKLKRGCKSNYKCPYILFKKACPIYNETLIIFNFGFSVLQRQWKKLSEFNKDRNDDILLIVTQIDMVTVVNRIV